MSIIGEKAKQLGEDMDLMIGNLYLTGIRYSEATKEFKKRFIEKALKRNKGNCCRAARELNMHRNTLSRTMAELKIDPVKFRQYSRRSRYADKITVIGPDSFRKTVIVEYRDQYWIATRLGTFSASTGESKYDKRFRIEPESAQPPSAAVQNQAMGASA